MPTPFKQTPTDGNFKLWWLRIADWKRPQTSNWLPHHVRQGACDLLRTLSGLLQLGLGHLATLAQHQRLRLGQEVGLQDLSQQHTTQQKLYWALGNYCVSVGVGGENVCVCVCGGGGGKVCERERVCMCGCVCCSDNDGKVTQTSCPPPPPTPLAQGSQEVTEEEEHNNDDDDDNNDDDDDVGRVIQTSWCFPPWTGLCVSTGIRKSQGIRRVPDTTNMLLWKSSRNTQVISRDICPKWLSFFPAVEKKKSLFGQVTLWALWPLTLFLSCSGKEKVCLGR